MPEKTETVESLTLLDQLRAKRRTESDALRAVIDARLEVRSAFEQREDAADGEKPSKEERAAFTSEEEAFEVDFTAREAKIKTLDKRIGEQEAIERSRKLASEATVTDARVTGEPAVYREDNGKEVSYFRDLCLTTPAIAQHFGGNPDEARERISAHGKNVEQWMVKRSAERERRATEQIDKAEREFHLRYGMKARGFDASPFERRVNPNRTPGQGGFAVPPLWLIEDYIPALRAGRVAADRVRHLPLPEGTDSINVPKIATGTRVGYQTIDGAAVPSQDLTDTSIQANVKTIAGQEDVAIQLLEQSPGDIMDRVIMEDLMADYNRFLDQQVLFGNGTNSAALNGGQILGLYPSTNWGANVVTWTTATPLGNGFNMLLGAMASKTAYSRFSLAEYAFLLHPRRWFWFATALDAADGKSGRPLVNPRDTGFNVSAINESNVPEQGRAGSSLFGPDVYIDANVPVTDNGSGVSSGTNDIAFGAIWDDIWLFEGDMRTRVLSEVLSGTLEVRFQVYNYVAMLLRYGQSVTIAQGTGFAPPVSAIDASVAF